MGFYNADYNANIKVAIQYFQNLLAVTEIPRTRVIFSTELLRTRALQIQLNQTGYKYWLENEFLIS